MFQIIKPASNTTNLVTVAYLNGNRYTVEELELFTKTVCKEVALNNLHYFLENNNYNHVLFQDLIHNISKGYPSYNFVQISDSAKKYHEELFDVMYVKKLNELPLMINEDKTIVPVVKWRLEIGK